MDLELPGPQQEAAPPRDVAIDEPWLHPFIRQSPREDIYVELSKLSVPRKMFERIPECIFPASTNADRLVFEVRTIPIN